MYLDHHWTLVQFFPPPSPPPHHPIYMCTYTLTIPFSFSSTDLSLKSIFYLALSSLLSNRTNIVTHHHAICESSWPEAQRTYLPTCNRKEKKHGGSKKEKVDRRWCRSASCRRKGTVLLGRRCWFFCVEAIAVYEYLAFAWRIVCSSAESIWGGFLTSDHISQWWLAPYLIRKKDTHSFSSCAFANNIIIAVHMWRGSQYG